MHIFELLCFLTMWITKSLQLKFMPPISVKKQKVLLVPEGYLALWQTEQMDTLYILYILNLPTMFDNQDQIQMTLNLFYIYNHVGESTFH